MAAPPLRQEDHMYDAQHRYASTTVPVSCHTIPASHYPTFPMIAVQPNRQVVNVYTGSGRHRRGPYRVNHLKHGILTALSCGAWAPVWALVTLWDRLR